MFIDITRELLAMLGHSRDYHRVIEYAYSTYQVWLSVENKAYQFYDGAFITYEEAQDARARAAAENVRTYAESLISQKSDEIELSITTVTGTLATDIQGVRDSLSQTADGLSGDMQELSQRVTDQEDALLDYKHEASTYFRFNTNGLNIGKQEDGDESPYSINIDNEKMAFYVMDRRLPMSNTTRCISMPSKLWTAYLSALPQMAVILIS